MSLRALVFAGVCTAMTFGSSGAGAQNNPVVVMETNLGSITIELLQDEAPISVKNFLQYVNDGFYDGTVFHRVIPKFMIQGGGMTSNIVGSLTRKETRGSIKNEATNGVSNERGTVAMARTAAVDSATAEFFINTENNGPRGLDHKGTESYGYAVFGRVIEGMDVVDKISAAPIQSVGSLDNVPTDPVVIQAVTPK